MRIVAVLGEIERGHPERIGLHLERSLSAEERFPPERVDFRHLRVAHRIAARRRAVAVDHEEGAAAAMRAVKGVGETEIEREIITRIGIHLAGSDRVEALRRLTVALLDLGAKVARPAADRIGLEQREAAGVVLLPDFQLGFFLEDADQDRRLDRHVLAGDQRPRLAGHRLHCAT